MIQHDDHLRPAARLTPGRCHVLAEGGQCMEGDVHRAVQMAIAAASAGAWGFKVQMLTPDRIAAEDAPIYWEDTLGNTTQREAFQRAGLVPYTAWAPVVDACREHGIAFAATPFDAEAVDACVELGVDAVKIASGDLTNHTLLDHAAEAADHLGARLIVSVGAATVDEVLAAMNVVHLWPGLHTTWLACSLVYPTPVWEANLARIVSLADLWERDNWTTGYSDHTRPTHTALAAAALGAVLLEKHYTDGRGGEVQDNDFALDAHDLEEYVENANEGARLRGVGDLLPTQAEEAARDGARRSVHLTRDLAAGDVIGPDDLIALRPAGGLSPEGMAELVGQRVAEAVPAGVLRTIPKLY